MKAYPCKRPRSVGQSGVSCNGTMMRVKSDLKGKQRFVCNQCLREGYWWPEEWDRNGQ